MGRLPRLTCLLLGLGFALGGIGVAFAQSPTSTPSPTPTATLTPTPRPTSGPQPWPGRVGPMSLPTEMPTIRPGTTPVTTPEPTLSIPELPPCGDPASGCRIVCDACPFPTLGGGGGGGGGGIVTPGPSPTPDLGNWGTIEELHQDNDDYVWCYPAHKVQLPIHSPVYIRRCYGLWQGNEYCAQGYQKWAGPQNRVWSFRLLHQRFVGHFRDWWHVVYYRLVDFQAQRYELTGESAIDPSAWADQFYVLRAPTGTAVLGGWGSAAYYEADLPGAQVFDEWGNWGYKIRVRCKTGGWGTFRALFESVQLLWDFSFDCDEGDWCDHHGPGPGAPPPGIPGTPPGTWPNPPFDGREYYPGCAPWELPPCCRCEFDAIVVTPVVSETRCLGVGPLCMDWASNIINGVAGFFGVQLNLQFGCTDRYEICFMPVNISILQHPLFPYVTWILVFIFLFAVVWLVRWFFKR